MLEKALNEVGTWSEDVWDALSALSADKDRDKFAEVAGENWVELLVPFGSDELEESIEEHVLVLDLLLKLFGCGFGSLSLESSIGRIELLLIGFGGGLSFSFDLLSGGNDWGIGLLVFWLGLLGIWFSGLGLLLWGGLYWSLLLWILILDLGGGWDFSFGLFLGFLDDWGSWGLGLGLLILLGLSFSWLLCGFNYWSFSGGGGCLGFLLLDDWCGRGLSLSFLG